MERKHLIIAILLICLIGIITVPRFLYVPVPPKVEGEPYIGPISVTAYTRDSLTGGGATITPEFYRLVDGEYEKIISGNATINLLTGDKGTIYLVLESSSYYIDDSRVKDANKEYVRSVTYADADNDGYLEHIFKMYFTDEKGYRGYITAPAGATPSLVLYCYGINCDTGIDFNSPSDVSGIGTAPTHSYVTWKFVWSAADRGVKLVKLYVATNATSEDEIKLVQVDSVLGAFGVDKITWESANQRWVVDITVKEATEPYGKLLYYKTGENPDEEYFTCKFWTAFGATTNAFTVTITAEAIKPDHTTLKFDDTVQLIKA